MVGEQGIFCSRLEYPGHQYLPVLARAETPMTRLPDEERWLV